MVKTRIIGDVHYKWASYMRIAEVVDTSVQVGDLGVGFFYETEKSPNHIELNKFMSSGTHRFIRGNHDNPQVASKMTGYIPDGTFENSVCFIGGAWSIDHASRTTGYSKWEDEELSTQQIYSIASEYEQRKPTHMIAHDCPASVYWEMFNYIALSKTSAFFDSLLDIHCPEVWIFGHHHKTKEITYRGTKFICLGELDYIDIDLPN